MKRFASFFLATVLCAAIPFAAQAADNDRYDRYERGPRSREYEPPPPRMGSEVPPPTHARYGQTYFFGRVGIFEPNDSSDGLKPYNSGGSFDLGIGSRVSPNLAVEGALGGYSADTGPNEVRVVPVTVGLRLILPSPVVEPYIGGGLGLYFAHLKEPSIPPFLDDSNTTFGGYGSLGVDAWLNPRMALNFEGKYHWVEPSFNGVDVKVGGWTLGIGIRVAF